MHSLGVPQAVRADCLPEAGMFTAGGFDMLLQYVANAPARQSPPLPVLKQRVVELLGTIETVLKEMITEKLHSAAHQRHCACLVAFSLESNLLRRIEADITDGQVDHFLHACAGIIEDTEQNRIAATGAGSQVGLREDRGQLFFGEIIDRRARMSPQRNRQDLLALQ